TRWLRSAWSIATSTARKEEHHGRAASEVRASRRRLQDASRKTRQRDAAAALRALQAGIERRRRRRAPGVRRLRRARQVGCVERDRRQVEGRGDAGVRRSRRVAEIASARYFLRARDVV